MIKKALYIIPLLGMVACTDYQANVENTWGNQDAAWQEQENYLNTLNAQRVCVDGRTVYQVSPDSNLISYVCVNNNWIIFCEEGAVQSYNPTGYVYRCQSNIWYPLSSMENDPSNPGNNQPPAQELESVNILSGGNFKNSCSTKAWNIETQGAATAEISVNGANLCELQFKANSTINDISSVSIKNSVNLHYGYSYQIRIQGSASNGIGVAYARASITGDANTFMTFDFNVNGTWESNIKNHCQATQTMTFSLEDLNASNFVIQKIEILRRPGKC